MKVGKVEIEKFAALAPMASVGDYAFRSVCKELGASYVVGEMASAKGMIYGNEKTKRLLMVKGNEHPAAVQLFGDDPVSMGKAAEDASLLNADIIDINMGCPVPKVAGSGSGCALMKDPALAEKIIKAVVSASNLPVTVKFRAGWDRNSRNAVEFAKMAESAGASAVTVHCRTKEEMYSFPVDTNIIKEVKSAVSIPVIGNGGIRDAYEAQEMYEKTGCDLVMIGTAALGNPFIFREVKELLSFGEIKTKATTEEKISVLHKQIKIAMEEKGERIALREARKHIMWYIKGAKFAASFKASAGNVSSFSEFEALMEEFLKLQNKM